MSAGMIASRGGLALAALVALAACASVPPPTDAIAQAELALQQAETAQAAVHAPGDLLRAREQLEEAKALARDEEYARARRLAEQSAADSQVAIAKSRAAIAEQTYQAAQRSMDVLRQQTAPAAGPTPLTR